jgi:CheY-like chemotaxis protein
MADILIVESDPALTEALLAACRRAGLQADCVRDGSEALSSLDWHPPRGLLCAASLPDMHGWELCAIVRADPKTSTLPFVLLVDAADEQREEVGTCGASLVAPRGGSVHMVPTLLRGLLGERHSGPHDHAPESLRGTFRIMGLPDLMQTIAFGGQPGQLQVTVHGVTGALLFRDGSLVHAEFGGRRGQEAVAELMEQSDGRQGSFVFVPGDPPAVATTIRKSVSQLLLDIAMELDHRRASLTADGVPPTART